MGRLPGSSERLLGGFEEVEEEKMAEADTFLEEVRIDLNYGSVHNTGNVMRASAYEDVPKAWEANLAEREAAFEAEMASMELEETVVSLAPKAQRSCRKPRPPGSCSG